MLALLLTLLGLLLGPLTYRAFLRREDLYGLLDGFVLVGVAGLVLSEVLPETVRAGGPWALALAAAGFVLPLALERRLALLPFSPHTFFRWLMILGLLLHQLLDGVALSAGQSARLTGLGLAVILHQIPKGFFIWGMVGGPLSPRLGRTVVAGLGVATAAGFILGGRLSEAQVLSAQPLWLFQAFIGGGLLHVIFHHVPRPSAAAGCAAGCGTGAAVPAAEGRFTLWSGVGALLSLAGLLALSGALPAPGGAGAERGFGDAFLDIAVESAPWILLGFAAAGAFQALIPRVIFSWVQARGRMSQALRGIALGLPLPLCSCGVVPVYLSLLKKGVPPAAALAFLVATPEIGIDSVFLSSSLLGIEITLIRLTMAFLIALAVGLTLARTFEKIQKAGQIDQLALPPERPAPRNLEEKLREALRFGGREIVDHTGAWLLVGIALAAVLEPYVKAEWLSQIPRGVDVLLFSLVGLPLYVCASGATPLAAVLLHKGISTGAVLALLITGPSTNITTFGILKRYHGAKGALLFAGWVYAFSIAIGFAINFLFPRSSAPIRQLPPHELHGPGAWVCLGLVAVLFAGSLIRLGPRGFLATLGEGLAGPEALGGEPAPHGHPHDHHHEGDRHPAAADPAHAAGARSGRAAD